MEFLFTTVKKPLAGGGHGGWGAKLYRLFSTFLLLLLLLAALLACGTGTTPNPQNDNSHSVSGALCFNFGGDGGGKEIGGGGAIL